MIHRINFNHEELNFVRLAVQCTLLEKHDATTKYP